MTPETARPFVDILPPVADALAAGRPVVALESTIITHGMPYPENSAMAANVEKIIARRRRDAGDDRRRRRPAEDRAFRRRARVAGRGDRRDEAVARRPRLRGRRGPHRRHDGCGDDDRRAPGRHKGVRDRRHRRRAQGRGEELRHLGRSRRAGAHAGHRRVGRRQGDPRHRKDAGSAGDARRAGRGVRLRRDAGLLVAAVALSRAAEARRSGGDRAGSSRRGARSGSRAACWSPTRCPRATRSRPR